MMTAWLVMALMLVASIVYLYLSVQKSLAQNSSIQRESFNSVRQREIKMEEEIGRLSAEESSRLLSDLRLEAQSMHQAPAYLDYQEIRVSRCILLAVSSFVVLGSVALYQHLGYAKEVLFTQHLQTKTATPKMVSDFLQYRSQRYGKAEDWFYEATNFMSTGNYQKALVAFQRTLDKLPPESPDRVEVMVQYAQALFYANNNQSSAKMEQVVNDVLSIDPKQATALGLKGVANFDNKDYKNAVIAWQDAARNNRNIDERNTLLSAIVKARQIGGISYKEIPPVITNAIAIKVDWDAKKVTWQPDDVLLVYARIPGQKMPIAIRKVSPKALGKPIVLTNLDNLMSSTTLQSVDKVDVIVKLSTINSSDLTKGRVIGIRKALPSNSESIYSIKVSL